MLEILKIYLKKGQRDDLPQNPVYEDEMIDNSNKIILHLCADIGSDERKKYVL